MDPVSAERETKMWTIAAAVFFLRAKRCRSIHEFIVMSIMYAKILACISAYFIDQRIAVIFCSIFISLCFFKGMVAIFLICVGI
jgi:hypothetical protein